MPVSKLAYYDIGLPDFREVGETSEDSQRVVYEDHRVEMRRLNSGPEASSEKPFRTELQFALDAKSAPSESTVPDFPTDMEGIQKYSGIGGGTKQDTKAVYNKMLRDHREHLLAGFGQWEFRGLLGSAR